jgi:hypothetical protein
MLDQWVYQPGLPANVARPDPQGLRRGRCGAAASPAARRRRVPPGPLDHRRAAALPQRPAARAATPRLADARPRLGLSQSRQRSAVRLAEARARQPLRAGGAGRGALPRLAMGRRKFVRRCSRPCGRRAIGAARSRSRTSAGCAAPTASRNCGSCRDGGTARRHRLADRVDAGRPRRDGLSMLLGREAIRRRFLIDPARSFRQSRRTPKAIIRPSKRSPMKIALLCRSPQLYSHQRIIARPRGAGP